MRLTLRNRQIALLGALLLCLLAATPTHAAATYRPDGWVRFHSERWDGGSNKYVTPSPWKGDDIYNLTGRYQTAKRNMIYSTPPPGLYYVFEVTIENDGAPDRFRIAASGTGNWQVKYFRQTTNITSDVVGGTYLTRSLAHGEKAILKMKVWVGYTDAATTRQLTITSIGNPGRADVVRVKASRSGCGC